jgi:hypothetical protein
MARFVINATARTTTRKCVNKARLNPSEVEVEAEEAEEATAGEEAQPEEEANQAIPQPCPSVTTPPKKHTMPMMKGNRCLTVSTEDRTVVLFALLP